MTARYFGALMLIPLAWGADDKVARGTVVYRTTCSVAYCHGPEGKPSRAPGFIGRNLSRETIVGIVTAGVRNTSMPAFEKILKEEDIQAVAAYLLSLGGGGPEAVKAAPVILPPDIERGRVLFFDPGRMGSCGYCHEIGDRGAPVSLALRELRKAKLDLKAIDTSGVMTAQPAGEDPFPAVVVERSTGNVRVYDLSSRLPVLRTFAPSAVTLTARATWQHSTASGLYTAAELESISRYLKWMATRK